MANTLCVRMLRLAAQPRGIVCGSGLTSFATGAAAAVTPGKPAVRAKRRAGAAHHRGLRGPACQARNRLHSSSGSSQQQAAAVSTRQLAPASTSTSSGVHARMLHTAPSTCKSLAGPAIGDPLLILKQSPGQTVVVIAPSMAHDVMVDTRWDMAEHTHALKDHGITVYLADASHSEEDGSAQGKMWRWDYTKGRTAGCVWNPRAERASRSSGTTGFSTGNGDVAVRCSAGVVWPLAE